MGLSLGRSIPGVMSIPAIRFWEAQATWRGHVWVFQPTAGTHHPMCEGAGLRKTPAPARVFQQGPLPQPCAQRHHGAETPPHGALSLVLSIRQSCVRPLSFGVICYTAVVIGTAGRGGRRGMGWKGASFGHGSQRTGFSDKAALQDRGRRCGSELRGRLMGEWSRQQRLRGVDGRPGAWRSGAGGGRS